MDNWLDRRRAVKILESKQGGDGQTKTVYAWRLCVCVRLHIKRLIYPLRAAASFPANNLGEVLLSSREIQREENERAGGRGRPRGEIILVHLCAISKEINT